MDSRDESTTRYGTHLITVSCCNKFVFSRFKSIARLLTPILVSSPARLEALSTVPFARDIEFVVRVDIMADLEAKLSAPLRHQRVALIGLGEMG